MQPLPLLHAGLRLNTQALGPKDPAAPSVLFLHTLGTNLGLWDGVVPLLPPSLRLIRHDLRGHGLSDAPTSATTMGALISEAEAVCAAHQMTDAVVVGLGIGGLIAQGLAVKRLDLVRGLVLSGSAARIGHRALWDQWAETAQHSGSAALAPQLLPRLFGRSARNSPAAQTAQAMLRDSSSAGIAGLCHAAAGTDFYTTTASLRLPLLAIAGADDGLTPPDLVRETADLVPGSRFALMRRVGHLPCLEAPEDFTAILAGFLHEIGHI